MEDDEEIQSHSSPETGSPASPRSNSRITVTVAAAPPLQNALTLELPIQQARTSGNSGGWEDCWSEGATSVLIEAWGERYLELSRGNLKQKHWKDVVDTVSSHEDYTKTPKIKIQCKNRIDTVMKKYKLVCFYRIYFFIFLVVIFWVFRGISETQKFSIFCCSPTAIKRG